MKHKKERFDEDDDDTKEFIFSDPKSPTEPVTEKTEDALFEVSKASRKDASSDEILNKGTTVTKETAVNYPDDSVQEQDALFEISDAAKGDTCDDGTFEPLSKIPKGENPADKKKDDLSLEKKKIEELSGQLEAANDKYLRLMAEFDNFKRRSAKEYERMIEAANEKLMKDITEVRENFERAFKSNAAGDKLLEGMKLIFSKLNAILQKHGLEVYAEAGQKFDPEVHDALMRMPHEKIEEGHVVEVHERGYKLKGNIIKHAKVVVSSGKPPKKETEDEAVIEIK
jgi:molecular chaperone GrpE